MEPLLLAAGAVALLGVFSVRTVHADYKVTVSAESTLVHWEGWGTSLVWWANVFGDRVDIADALFTTTDAVSIPGTGTVPGLGLNIVRYNIGGSGSNTIDYNGTKVSMRVSSHMPAFKIIDSYWLDWFNTDPASPSWNWTLDAKQRAMLLAAKARGANVVEAFSNSPPWWMTNNHAVAGANDGNYDNLQSWNHEQFALYLALVTKYAHDNWGITFDYVEPFNEPISTWWQFPDRQEGCHFSIDSQKSVLLHLRKQLDTYGLHSVDVAASDENSVDITKTTLTALAKAPEVLAALAKVNTHGYYHGLDPYRGNNRGPLRDLVHKYKKKFWDSEYGEADASGLSMAESIGLDINEMSVSAFVYWQALDSGAWGLLQSNPGDNWIGSPNPKYYVMAHYSRHIRQGMQLVVNNDKKTVVAYDASHKTLVIVTLNKNTTTAQRVTYDLSSYSAVGLSATVWTTVTTDSGARYQKSVLACSGTTLEVSSPAASVVTIEIGGVTVTDMVVG